MVSGGLVGTILEVCVRTPNWGVPLRSPQEDVMRQIEQGR